MATTVSYGKCTQCGDNNAMVLKACRSCGAVLPWAVPAPPKPTKAKPAKVKPSSGDGSATVMFWVIGMALFILAVVVPFIGFRIHRFLDGEYEFAGFPLYGSMVGIAVWILAIMAAGGSHAGVGSH